jgi:secreted Zn-dependent insulinase-like peptidase
MVKCVKKHAITIIAISLVVVAVVVTVVVVVVTRKNNKKNEGSKIDGGGSKTDEGESKTDEGGSDDDKKEIILTVLKNDSQLKKPNVKLNAEFEYVKMGNNMTGLIISDPYASTFHIQFSMKYGGYIDTVSGISHFGEHMVLQNCEKYNYLYPILNGFSNLKNSQVNAVTSGTYQMYYITLPFNLYYEKAMDILTESFRHPLYSPEIVKNEIQAVNHEFYDSFTSGDIEEDIIRQLSNDQTPFNGMLCGNNQTLIPSESEKLSKKLKGYHMVIKNPNRIFFTLYSNKTMNESEEIAKKYLNYKMHIFPDNEIDIEDKKKLEQNLLDIESIEIFDDKLYKHGFCYNTNSKSNLLQIYYYIGNAEFRKLKFYIINYIDYLLKSKSLM